MRNLVFSLFVCGAGACDSFGFPPAHDERETLALDTESHVEVRLNVQPSFPDPTANARVVLVRQGRAPLAVLEDWAQAQSLRSHTRATRLAPGGPIAVYLREKLCVLSVGAASFVCRRTGEGAPSPWANSSFNEDFLRGLEWVSANQDVFSAESTSAALLAATALGAPAERTCATLAAAMRGAERENNERAIRALEARRTRCQRPPQRR